MSDEQQEREFQVRDCLRRAFDALNHACIIADMQTAIEAHALLKQVEKLIYKTRP